MSIGWDPRSRSWYYRIRKRKGREPEWKNGFPTKKEARSAEQSALAKLTCSTPQTPTEPKTATTFEAVANSFLDYLQARCTPGYYRDTKLRITAHLAPFLDLAPEAITRAMVEEYLAQRAAFSNHAANIDLRTLKRILTHGVEIGLVEHNHLLGVKLLPETRTRKYVPSRADMRRFLAALTASERAMVSIFLGTGCRWGEISRLRWADVRMSERFLIVRTRKRRGGCLEEDPIGMNADVVQAFEFLASRRDRDPEWVFPSGRKEGPVGSKKKWLKARCARAGVKPFSWHAFRHYAAALTYERAGRQGQNPFLAAMKLLRHSRPSTTDKYLQSLIGPDPSVTSILENPVETESASIDASIAHVQG